MFSKQRLIGYMQLMRWHRPIGFFLLLWPTLWALWLASAGNPDQKIMLIFMFGVVFMRSAGCVINDIVDRHIDGFVQRTQDRPLVTGRVSVSEALALFFVLCGFAFLLVLQLNLLTILLAFAGALLTVLYPFMKRLTYLPQVVLGVVFGGWPILMVFAAQLNAIPTVGWQLFLVGCLWPVAYDTLYARVDREDDRRIGIKSTAILLKHYDRWVVLFIQLLMLLMLVNIALSQAFQLIFYITLSFALGLIGYQHYLLKQGQPEAYFKVFLNNNWFGMVVFIGFFLNFL